MKVSWIKYEKDNKDFKIAERLGMDVYKIKSLEEVDSKMQELIKEDYNTIVLSNKVASFSEDIIKKYQNKKDINIIISPRKNV